MFKRVRGANEVSFSDNPFRYMVVRDYFMTFQFAFALLFKVKLKESIWNILLFDDPVAVLLHGHIKTTNLHLIIYLALNCHFKS